MPKRTLITIPRLDITGGVTNYYTALSLDKEDHIEYFSVTGGEQGVRRYVRLIRIYFALLFKLPSFDCVLINPSLDRKSFWRDAVVTLLARLFCDRVMVFWRGWDWHYFRLLESSKLHRFVYQHTFGKSDDTIYLARSFHNAVVEQFGESDNRVHFETTVADDSFVEQPPSAIEKSAENITILFMSRMDRRKGIYIVFDVYAQLKQEYPQLRLVMAGSGDELQPAKDYVDDKQIADVSFPGYLRGPEKHQAYLDADIFLFPTYYGEGMPNCVLEALLYGVPVVSTYVAGIPDVVTDGVNGFLIDSRDAADFLPVVKKLVSNPHLRGSMGAAAHRDSERFTLSAVRNRMLHLIAL